MSRLRLVALGSSFAAGSGIAPIVHRKAMRSGRNYAHLLALRLNSELDDLTVSGATLLNVLDQPQRLFSITGGIVPPQLDGVPGDADVVTVTAGGNDIFYSGGMILDALRASIRTVPVIGGLLASLIRPDSSHHSVDEDELTSRFVAVIDKIASVAPKARIVLIDYLTVFGPGSYQSSQNPLADVDMEKHQQRERTLQQAYINAAKARPFILSLSASTMSREHGVGTSEPWVTGFSMMMLARGDVPYHPNAVGHENIAEALYRLLIEESEIQGREELE